MQPFHAFHRPRRSWASLACIGLCAWLMCLPSRARSEALTLDTCLVRALEHSLELRAADQDIRAAHARIAQAGALEAPSLDYEVGKLGTPVSRDEHETSLRLTQELGAPGARGRAKAVARAELAISEATRASLALKLRGDVTRAYRRLQADALSLHRLESLRRTAVDFEQMVSARLRTGGARYLDVLRARSERARIENDAVEGLRALREDRRALNTFLARGPEEPLEPADSLRYIPLADSLQSLLASALSQRPRLRAAQLEVERSESQVGLARNGLMPSASVSAGLDRVPGADGPGIGGAISFTLPFAPWTSRRSRITEAQASSSGARTRLEASRRDVDLAVRNAFEAARSAEQQVQQFDRVLLADAADAIRTATQNYQAGQIDGLELFETLRTFRSIELEYIRALLNYELALTDLSVVE